MNLNSNNGIGLLSELQFKKLRVEDLIVDNNIVVANLDLTPYTQAERDALTPSTGQIIYNTSVFRIQYYNGLEWLSFENEYIYLDDYNIGADATTDSAPQIQQAVNKAIQEKKPLYFPPGKRELRIDSQITVSIDSTSNYFVLYGNGCKIFPNFNNAGFFINPLCPAVNIGSGQEVAHFEIHDLDFDGFFETSFTNTRAIQIGRNGFALSDFGQCLVKNCTLINFTKAHPIYIEGTLTRHIIFDTVISRDNGWQILSNQSGGFIGDMIFNACEATYKSGGLQALNFFVQGAEMRGIRFINCTFYGGSLNFGSGVGGLLADFWFSNCSIDQGVANTKGILINGSGGAIIQFFIQNLYAVAFTNTVIDFLLNGDSVNTSGMILISGGQFNFSTMDSYIVVQNGVDVHIENIQFRALNLGVSCVQLFNTIKSVVKNCSYVGGASIPSMIFLDVNCSNNDIINNSGDVGGNLITNTSSSSTNNISGNRKHSVEGVEALDTLQTNYKDNSSYIVEAFGGSLNNGSMFLGTSSNKNKRMAMGYDGVNDCSVIQSIEAGVNNKPLFLNPSGGSVSMLNSTSDTLTIKGNQTVQGSVRFTSVDAPFEVNKLTTAQRTSIIAISGMVCYDVDLNRLAYFNGSLWVLL